MAFFPLFIDLKDKKVLLVGAGRVGYRRLEILLSFGAAVTVVEPNPSQPILEMDRRGNIKLAASDYREYRRMGREAQEMCSAFPFFMVLAATGIEEVDSLVEKDARLSKIFVNVAGHKERSDFYFPGIVRAGDITAGITANGRDHQLAKDVTKKVEDFLHTDLERQSSE